MRAHFLQLSSLLMIILFGMTSAVVYAQENNNLSLMPAPASVRQGNGQFVINDSFAIAFHGYTEPRLQRAGERFLKNLALETGIRFHSDADAARANFVLNCKGPGEKVQTLGEDESYRLEVTSSGVQLEAPTPLGLMHGLQTFLQLVQATPQGFAAPAVVIEDKPRFPWRGLMLDVSRHFSPLDVVKRNLDAMEALKLNVFHWHLSDDQGFRVESKRFPKFQQLSSDGLYYTQAEIQEIIEYAHDRGIRVVPEFDMPGHTTSWFVAYPELASGPGPYQIERHWGIFNPAIDPTRDSTYQFLDALIGEMTALFPDQYFHVGGDEVNGKQWDSNPQIQQFMRAHGLKKNDDLQAYFNTRVQAIVQNHGKIMEGWDEVLRPDIPKEIVIQSWRGQKSLGDAARMGYRGLLSAGYYLDLMQPAAQHYLVDPFDDGAANLTPEQRQRILGGEACMWAEYITPENVDQRIWPRAAAVAERLWSPQDVRDVDSMYRRLAIVSRNLAWRGMKNESSYPFMLQRMSGQDDIHTLKVLSDVLESVKQYTRGQLGVDYTSFTPLNRLVDAVPPESQTAREFSKLVDRIIAKQASSDEINTARTWLTAWRDNNKQLQPILQKSMLLQEIVPLSQNMEGVASAGLQALDYLGSGKHASAEWRNQQQALLQNARKPTQAALLNMVVPSVLKLVYAASGNQ
ncbi:MAG TPA: family 20 glycosylhydrolase [Terriglobales bacterium]